MTIKEVRLHPKALRFLHSLPEKEQRRIKMGLRGLISDPYTHRSGADVRKLRGSRGGDPAWRLRIGRFRAVYEVKDGIVWVTRIFERGAGYDP